jgi:hypothetical protein
MRYSSLQLAEMNNTCGHDDRDDPVHGRFFFILAPRFDL